jgi:DNA-binding LytR/AlgR family response regulator
MLRIAVCDDEPSFISQLHSILSAWRQNLSRFSVESFDNGDALLKSHAESPFDIILLDVVMPMFNGIEVARELREQDAGVKIVFLTSSPEYAVESYTVKANNYLLKPIDHAKLYQCLDELCDELLDKNQKSIHIRCTNAIHKIPLSNIEYVEAQNKHTLFTLRNKPFLESIDSLYHHEDMLTLTDGFIKCHRSYIVNINHIDTYTTKEIRMRSGYRIPISRNCQNDFENAYFSYTFKKAGERT